MFDILFSTHNKKLKNNKEIYFNVKI